MLLVHSNAFHYNIFVNVFMIPFLGIHSVIVWMRNGSHMIRNGILVVTAWGGAALCHWGRLGEFMVSLGPQLALSALCLGLKMWTPSFQPWSPAAKLLPQLHCAPTIIDSPSRTIHENYLFVILLDALVMVFYQDREATSTNPKELMLSFYCALLHSAWITETHPDLWHYWSLPFWCWVVVHAMNALSPFIHPPLDKCRVCFWFKESWSFSSLSVIYPCTSWLWISERRRICLWVDFLSQQENDVLISYFMY